MSFRVIVRGCAPRIAIEDYECPVHGRFEAQVDRDESGDAPSTIPCPADDDCYDCGGQPSAPGRAKMGCDTCGLPSEWRISAPLAKVRAVEALRGKSEKPERATWLDTTNLGEGQSLQEFQDDRAHIREEARKRDVMEFARAHHERLIGHD
ncbi:MAG TPA: hypothetical protein VGF94_08470 [Kofleriaceae bacterium]|jgi:hypothetical protein